MIPVAVRRAALRVASHPRLGVASHTPASHRHQPLHHHDRRHAVTTREATVHRQTRETDITVALKLDGTGAHTVATGIGFLDHMLAQLAAHGRLDLEIAAKGDLQIDDHHTVEDVALALGEALANALGDRRGIARYGHAIVPMDESLATVALDFSGRGMCVFNATFDAPTVGQLTTQLVPHFFHSLATRAGLTLHIKEEHGRNDHHRIEGIFKAFARALRMAVIRDDARGDAIPSTKGTLTG